MLRPQASMLAPAAWAAFTAGEGDGYGGPLSVLFDESPACAAKDVMRKVLHWTRAHWSCSAALYAVHLLLMPHTGVVLSPVRASTAMTDECCQSLCQVW
jgi:hypothetical protein